MAPYRKFSQADALQFGKVRVPVQWHHMIRRKAGEGSIRVCRQRACHRSVVVAEIRSEGQCLQALREHSFNQVLVEVVPNVRCLSILGSIPGCKGRSKLRPISSVSRPFCKKCGSKGWLQCLSRSCLRPFGKVTWRCHTPSNHQMDKASSPFGSTPFARGCTCERQRLVSVLGSAPGFNGFLKPMPMVKVFRPSGRTPGSQG